MLISNTYNYSMQSIRDLIGIQLLIYKLNNSLSSWKINTLLAKYKEQLHSNQISNQVTQIKKASNH